MDNFEKFVDDQVNEVNFKEMGFSVEDVEKLNNLTSQFASLTGQSTIVVANAMKNVIDKSKVNNYEDLLLELSKVNREDSSVDK